MSTSPSAAAPAAEKATARKRSTRSRRQGATADKPGSWVAGSGVLSGFYLPELTTKAALNLLGAQRSALQELVDVGHRERLVERIVERIDSYCLARHFGGVLDAEMRERGADSAWWACTEELQAERDAANIDECGIELVLFMTPRSGRVIGFVKGQRAAAREHLLRLSAVVDFKYTDAITPPDGVQPREWRRRAKIWHEVLEGADVAKFTMSFTPQYAMPEHLKALLPSHAQRVERHARESVRRHHMQAWGQDPEKVSASDLERAHRLADGLMGRADSELGQLFEHTRERYAKALLPSLGDYLMVKLEALPGLPPLRGAA